MQQSKLEANVCVYSLLERPGKSNSNGHGNWNRRFCQRFREDRVHGLRTPAIAKSAIVFRSISSKEILRNWIPYRWTVPYCSINLDDESPVRTDCNDTRNYSHNSSRKASLWTCCNDGVGQGVWYCGDVWQCDALRSRPTDAGFGSTFGRTQSSSIELACTPFSIVRSCSATSGIASSLCFLIGLRRMLSAACPKSNLIEVILRKVCYGCDILSCLFYTPFVLCMNGLTKSLTRLESNCKVRLFMNAAIECTKIA